MTGGNGVTAADRVLAPLERRTCEVTDARETGGYRVFTVADADGPDPAAGQFYMLTGPGWGTATGRPYLPRAFSFATAERVRGGIAQEAAAGDRPLLLSFLLEAIGPGTDVLGALERGDPVELTGPLGRPFSPPHAVNVDAAGAILVGGGIGIAPLAAWRRSLVARGVPTRTLLGFRDRAHSGGTELFGNSDDRSPAATSCSELRLASEDGHTGHRGYVTDLLAVLLEGEDARRSGVVYACGPPAMLEAVRVICAEGEVACELAMESPMGCGFGACFGCAVPLAAGGFMRLCVDGPVVRGEEIETALVAGSGH